MVSTDLQNKINANSVKLIDDAKDPNVSQEQIAADLALQVALQAQATPDSSGNDELDRMKHLGITPEQNDRVMHEWDTMFGGEKNLESLPDLAKLASAHMFASDGPLNLDATVGSETVSALDSSDRDILTRITQGNSLEWGSEVRASLRKLTSSDAYIHASVADQATQISQYLKDEPWLHEGADPGSIDTGQRDGARVPTDLKTIPQTEDDKTKQVSQYELTIHTSEGDIVMPVTMSTADPTKTLTLDQVTKALAQVPFENLKVLTHVNVNPGDNFSAGANNQTFTFSGSADSQNGIDRVALHETSHGVEGTLHNAPAGPSGDFGAQWNAAIAKDKLSVSSYGDSSPTEDYAEASRRYIEVKGTPDEAAARAMYPARFALLDRVYGGDLEQYVHLDPPTSGLSGQVGPTTSSIGPQDPAQTASGMLSGDLMSTTKSGGAVSLTKSQVSK